MIRAQINIRPVIEQDRGKLANLIHFELYVHRHLDWRPPLDWIGHHPYLIAEKHGVLMAVLVCPPNHPEIAWIRLFAVSADLGLHDAWEALWPVALEQLTNQGETSIAAIPMMGWFRELLERSGFSRTTDVILLRWESNHTLPEPKKLDVLIRPMNYDDLVNVAEVDSSAFGPVWRNSLDSLKIAYRQVAIATVAEKEGEMIGYQISTASPMGGHLARLAVRPQYQKNGIGYALVKDALDQFKRRGTLRVTVNTQKDNAVSLSLYLKAGFQSVGEEYPVYQYKIDDLVARI